MTNVIGFVQWDDLDNQNRPEEVEISLRGSDGTNSTSVAKADPEGLWYWHFNNLLVSDEENNPITYNVTPQKFEEYNVQCELVNLTEKPEEGTKPSDISNEEKTTKSEEGTKPSGSSETSISRPVAASTNTNAETPKTGDDSNMVLWLVMMLASLATLIAAAAAIIKRRK